MIESVKIINQSNSIVNPHVDIILSNPEESYGVYYDPITRTEIKELSGFAITDMAGLGPGSATTNSTDIVTIDGTITNSVRLSARTISFNMLFLDAYEGVYNDTISAIRRKTYRYMPIKGRVKLEFTFDDMYYKEIDGVLKRVKRKYFINGIVSKNEPDIFSDACGTSIEIKCDDPYFYDYYDVVTDIGDSIGKFHSNGLEFTSNLILPVYSRYNLDKEIGTIVNSKVCVSKLIKMNDKVYGKLSSGDYVRVLTKYLLEESYSLGFPNDELEFAISYTPMRRTFDVSNDTDLEIGFNIDITFSDYSGKSIYINNYTTNERLVLNQNITFNKGDTLSIVTIPGKKQIKINGENRIDIMDLEKSSWLYLIPGANRLGITFDESSYYMNANIKFSCRYKYEGV